MKTIGIIGGMGPLATVDLFHKIVALTRAESDMDHIHIFIDNNTEIPDRTAAILEGGPSPVPMIVSSALKLQGVGADLLLIPCNTAHYFFDEIIKEVKIPILNMPYEAASHVSAMGIKVVGLLATDGTCQTGIYDKAFSRFNIEVLKPSPERQKHVMDLIYKGVKAGRKDCNLKGFMEALAELKVAGAELFVLGCTELPLAFSMYGIEEKAVDPTEVLAIKAILTVGKQCVHDA